MSSTDNKHGKTELNISTHTQKDKDKSGDYAMSNAGADKTKEKHDKTTITFERKKCDDKTCQDKEHHHSWNKDKDLNQDLHKDKEIHFESKDMNKDNKEWNKELNKEKDFSKDKDFNKDLHKDKDMHDKSEEHNKGGIINTIKEKVKDVLGAGDNDKSKDKDLHKENKEYNKDLHKENKDLNKDLNKDVHMSSSADYNKQKDEKFGSSTVGVSSGSSGAQYQSSNLASSNLTNDKTYTGSAAVGTGYNDKTHTTGSAVGTGYNDNKTHTGSAVGAGYSAADKATVDHQNLGAEHREVGYDKQSNVIPSKEKDTVHKVDVHGSLYTSGAGSTFKTSEAK